MKTLQNNFTTPEQSKRLLELGVPEDSADCFYKSEEMANGDILYKGAFRLQSPKYQTLNDYIKTFANKDEYLPCWSVGRLMEVCKICGSYELAKEIHGRALMYLNIVDGCICEMSYEIYKGHIDFSKLED